MADAHATLTLACDSRKIEREVVFVDTKGLGRATGLIPTRVSPRKTPSGTSAQLTLAYRPALTVDAREETD